MVVRVVVRMSVVMSSVPVVAMSAVGVVRVVPVMAMFVIPVPVMAVVVVSVVAMSAVRVMVVVVFVVSVRHACESGRQGYTSRDFTNSSENSEFL